jgi:hypothetical protein
MNRKLKGPVSSARVIGLSQKHFAPEAKNTIRGISEDDLRQCRGAHFSPIIL